MTSPTGVSHKQARADRDTRIVHLRQPEQVSPAPAEGPLDKGRAQSPATSLAQVGRKDKREVLQAALSLPFLSGVSDIQAGGRGF